MCLFVGFALRLFWGRSEVRESIGCLANWSHAHALGSAGGTINVCGAGTASPTCALYLRSMMLYNLGTSDPASIERGPNQELVAALGNYSSMLWNFAYSR